VKHTQYRTERGRSFEKKVGRLLGFLQENHPTTVSYRSQPQVELHNGEKCFADFELTCTFPHIRDIRLIECQDREESSQDVQRKIRHVKSLSKHNRVLFVFKRPDYLSAAVGDSLHKDGVLTYDLLDFIDFLRRLDLVLKASESIVADPTEISRALEDLDPKSNTSNQLPMSGQDEPMLAAMLREYSSGGGFDPQAAMRLTSLASKKDGKDEVMLAEARPDWRPDFRRW
jgi:hypothetical protein